MDNKKRKLLFVAFFMTPGGCGACTSLVNFVNHFHNDFDIDIAVIDKSHGSFETILSKCNIIEVCENTKDELIPKQEPRQRSSFSKKTRGVLGKFGIVQKLHKTFTKPKPQFMLPNPKFIKIDKQYDVVAQLSVFDPYMTKYVAEYVDAKKKFAFIHADFTIYRMHLDVEAVKDYKIFTVARTLALRFKKMYPTLDSDYLYNFQDIQKIISFADKESIELSGTPSIVTCVRIAPQKAILRSIHVFNKLAKQDFDFHWTIVGDGPEKQQAEELISKYNLQNYITMVGSKLNPFPYVKAADLFFLGSVWEAAPMVYGESMTLGVPVLTTNIVSAEELVGNKGFICPSSPKGIYRALKHLLQNQNLIEEKRELLKDYKYPNDEIRAKFLELAGE